MNIVWLHGWGQNKKFMEPLGAPFKDKHNCYFLDMPGFGEAELPDCVWGSDDYADYVAKWMKKEGLDEAVFIGHSMGGKIALQMAIRHPEHTQGIVMIAASGIKRERSLGFKLRAWTLKRLAKMAGVIDAMIGTQFKIIYGNKFGSADYRAAQGIMRDILVKHVNEDLSVLAPYVMTPTLLIFGGKDTATPPESGRRYHELLKNSAYVELPDLDHYSIIQDGRPQTQNHINQFLKKLPEQEIRG